MNYPPNLAQNPSRRPVRFWEKWRLVYNLSLIPPAWLGFVFGGASLGLDGEEREQGERLVLLLLAVLAANVCYSLVYVFEFLFGDGYLRSAWNLHGRYILLTAGGFLGLGLAFLAAFFLA